MDFDHCWCIVSFIDVSMLKAELFPTPAPPTDVALSSNNLTLSVCVREGVVVKCLFYDIRILSSKVSW